MPEPMVFVLVEYDHHESGSPEVFSTLAAAQAGRSGWTEDRDGRWFNLAERGCGAEIYRERVRAEERIDA